MTNTAAPPRDPAAVERENLTRAAKDMGRAFCVWLDCIDRTPGNEREIAEAKKAMHEAERWAVAAIRK